MANISHYKHCDPVYEEMPGWMAPTRECRRFEDLPEACRSVHRSCRRAVRSGCQRGVCRARSGTHPGAQVATRLRTCSVR